MREYLFRGKRKDNGQWVFGGILQDADSVAIVAVESFPGYFNPCSGYGEPPSSELCDYSVDPNTVGQYSGRKDKNGKHIFEGDIVAIDVPVCDLSISTYPYTVERCLGVIEYDEDTFTYKIVMEDVCDFVSAFTPQEIEVVGNIFENPELVSWRNNKNVGAEIH